MPPLPKHKKKNIQWTVKWFKTTTMHVNYHDLLFCCIFNQNNQLSIVYSTMLDIKLYLRYISSDSLIEGYTCRSCLIYV